MDNKASFSERYGHEPIRESFQIESMDEPLRNGLWSLLKIHCWNHVEYSSGYSGYSDIGDNYRRSYNHRSSGKAKIKILCERLWFGYYKKPLDDLSDDWEKVLAELRRDFFACKWNEVYDFIQFVGNNYEKPYFKDDFMKVCNNLLEKEMSAYRFVGGVITRITEQPEMDAIEQAIETSEGPVADHLKRSLELLSDRKSPDYRNSVKESISAVESLLAITLENNKGKFSQLIKKLEGEIDLHPALGKAFSNLYGYASNEGGIRHALKEAGRNVDFNDAKFMIVVCSAFTSFVKAKLKIRDNEALLRK